MSEKTAFITGANRGLGRGFVEFLVNQGYRVFAGVRSTQTQESLFSDQNVTLISLDVTSDVSIQQAVTHIATSTDCIDLLVNNAGANKDSCTQGHPELVCKLTSLDRRYLSEIFNVNTISPLLVTKAVLPLLVAQPSFVINISSDRASFHDEIPNSSANYGYRASKVALNMMTFCSVQDLPVNVKTFAVHPGSVHTDMNPKGENTPYEQASKIFKLIENWQDEFNGRFLRDEGGYYPL